MSDNEIPMLREKQIGQLAFYVHNPKCLDTSDPGTGKTPPCCVYSFMMWDRGQKKTVWSQPKSLLSKNLKEMVRFTEFNVTNPKKYTPGDDVAIMHTDRANLTKNWTGPTLQSSRRIATWKLRDGTYTHEHDFDDRKPCYAEGDGFVALRTGKPVLGDMVKWAVVDPLPGPDGLPRKEWVDVPETFKDLIQAYAQDGVKVFICTFAFLSTHWERLLEAAPDIDLFLVDELHMGYGGPESKQTESFYYVNRHCSRFVGMTGTLINGRLDSAFPAIHAIQPAYYGSYHGFIYNHAAAMDDYGRVILWKNEDRLRQIIEKHSIRRTFEEVYGEEDVHFEVQEIELHEKVLELYDKFHDEAMLELEDLSIIEGTNPGVALIRARQILAHPETMFKGMPEWTEKDERLRVLFSKHQCKGLIFASLKPEQERIKRLCESMGMRTAIINGDVSGPQRVKIDEAVQRGEIDVVVASSPTVAVGFNWEQFDLVVFASIDYQDVNILQAYRRASRGSRTKTLYVVFLRYEDTIERRMYQIVKKKSELANRVDPTRRVLDLV